MDYIKLKKKLRKGLKKDFPEFFQDGKKVNFSIELDKEDTVTIFIENVEQCRSIFNIDLK